MVATRCRACLRWHADPVTAFDAATKQYVDSLLAIGLPPGGPFLPLTGGTVTGAITSRQYLTGFPPVVFSGNTVPLPIAILTGAVSGSTTLSASTTVGLRLGTAGDTLTSSTGYGVHFLNINYNNGAGMNGVRAGIIGNMQIATPTTFSRVTDGLIGISFTMAGSASTGGTTAPGGSRGQLFAANLAARIDPGVTGWNGCVGGEVNTGVAAGGAVAQHVAWQVIQFSTHAVQGYLTDAAIRIGAQSQSTPGWRNGITIGDPYSEWPISRTNGYLFQSEIGVSSDTCAAAGGFDVQQVDFTGMAGANGGGFAFRADGVQLLPGTPNGGGVQAGYATLMGSSTGAALDCNYQQMSGTPTVNSGGTGWNVGDVAAGANSIVKVTTVTGGGRYRRGCAKTGVDGLGSSDRNIHYQTPGTDDGLGNRAGYSVSHGRRPPRSRCNRVVAPFRWAPAVSQPMAVLRRFLAAWVRPARTRRCRSGSRSRMPAASHDTSQRFRNQTWTCSRSARTSH